MAARRQAAREALKALDHADTWVQVALFDDGDGLVDEDLAEAWNDTLERLRGALNDLQEDEQ